MSDQDTAGLVVLHIADQLADLERRISVANSPGCLDGLFAQQVLREITPRSFTWQVNPLTDRWLEQNADRLTDAPQLAALGYGLAHADAGGDIAEEARKRLAVGLTNLMRRDPYPSDRVTFLNDPRQLLGIANAAAAVRSELPQPAAWLAKVIEDPRFRGDDIRHDLMRRHLRCVLIDEAPRMADTPDAEDAVLLSLIYWMTTAGTVRVPDPATDLKIIQRGVLNGLMRVPASALSAPDAALLLAAATRVVEETIDSAVLNRSHVGTVLRRFPAAMRRWRYDPATLKEPGPVGDQLRTGSPGGAAPLKV